MPQVKEYDLFVIGAGSGGVRAARWSASLGAKVGICEEYRYGGTCVVRGCVPKKFMVLAAHFGEDFEASKAYGWDFAPASFDWKRFKDNRDREIQRLSDIYRTILAKNKVEMFDGKGVIQDPNTVQIGEDVVKAKKIIIATGGRPTLPPITGIEHAMTSNDMFTCEKRPEQVLIVGSGYIAVEFAGILNGLGTKVDLAIRKQRVLGKFDRECAEFLMDQMQHKGIAIHTQTSIESIAKQGQKFHCKAAGGKEFAVDAVLYATGRAPNSDGLGLENAGIELGPKKQIKVDSNYQTSCESIYAIGDVTDRVQLTPVATAEGTHLSEFLFKQKPIDFSYDHIPSAVFSSPPYCCVGLTEEEASAREEIEVYASSFRPLKYTLTDLQEKTLMKLLVGKKSQKVLGAHMVGADAPEIMQTLAVAMKMGATKADFDRTVGIHPTSAEEWVTLRTPRL